MKVKTSDLFTSKNDVRKYCTVDMMEEQKEYLVEELGISYEQLESILDDAGIWVSMDQLPEFTEVTEVV